MTNQEIIKHCLNLLNQNQEWINRYAGYALTLKDNEKRYLAGRRKFMVKKPLVCYTSVSKAKGGVQYDLRYKGQSVASLVVKGNDILLSAEPKIIKSSCQYYFQWDKALQGVDWHSSEATEFRRHFHNLEDSERTKSREHCIESQMLLELNKKQRSQNKLMCNIQPVKLLGCFFQMPTPFHASNHNILPTYTVSGGGIEILARVRHTGNETRLCVCELKDENKPTEPETQVIQQALAYATFIGKLLFTHEAESSLWWSLFGFDSKLPNNLDIDVVTMMPPPQDADKHRKTEDMINLHDYDETINVTLHLHSVYFNADTTGKILSISGSLKEIIDTK